MKKFIAVFLVFSVLTISGNLHAKERRGAELVIQKKDGKELRGELIAVKQNSLLLNEARSGGDVTIDIKDIRVIKIVRKSKAGWGFLAGVGIESFRGGDLGSLNKKTSVQTNNEAIRILQKLGVSISAHFIINPDYTKKDFQKLLKYVCDMNLYRLAFPILTPLLGTELFFNNYDRLAIRDYDFFDFMHSILPTKLDRKEFYRSVSNLYGKSYSFYRYFKSKMKDFRSLFVKSEDYIPFNVDRISFFRLILAWIFSLPLYLRLKRNYKSEPLI